MSGAGTATAHGHELGARAAARVHDAFDRIAAVDRPEVWITLRDRAAVVAEAEAVDPTLPLAGLLFAVKDNIDVAGLPTTAASRSYAYEPTQDATAVARLRAAGAIVVGKTNLDQFATGLVGTRSPFGAVRNAWDPTRISGGSSSGSAIAVALGVVDFALGTDTAGSGRVPAALGGIVGVKPTKGLVPTTGVVPACRSQDCVTVFARSLDLARTAIELMSGPDGVDPLARPDAALSDGSLVALPPVPRIAVPQASQLAGLAPGWAEAFARAVDRFRSLGHEVVEVDITPLLDAAALLYDGAFVAERYAAVGAHIEAHRDEMGADLDPTVAGIVLGGAASTAAKLFADQERLDSLGAAGRAALDGTTALLTPTTTWHPTLDEVAADPVGANSRMGRYTNFANLLDMASLAVPAGFVDGLPFGVMLTGPAFSDRRLAALAAAFAAPTVDLLVVGAHLRDQPLNGQLVAAGGTFLQEARTTSDYRLHVLDTVPPKPGLVRAGKADAGDGVGDGASAGIAGEVWRLPAAGFATFVAALPAPMAIGTVTLADGTDVTGFLVEPYAVEGAEDITRLGGWRAYRQQLVGARA
ncbi:allophanate hydrolase [Curtobacterium sp. 'Ferrero']|uniref:allophanate hydrolase n=1 Tax=Curtobacterium sp. 'Ferrero' TaxID=2033654 RepID=UPI000BDA98BB|nr:allophanate hydrolase [Curtobacterium sp. 'Ferrero']PCN47711.1 allophanate hydrolase [Curtobacterium sp. 'Ferrero']